MIIRPIDQFPQFQPTRKETQLNDGSWLIQVTPPEVIGRKPTVEVMLTPGQFNRYQQWRRNEGMIQDLLPELNRLDREKLMTGLLPGDSVWKEEE